MAKKSKNNTMITSLFEEYNTKDKGNSMAEICKIMNVPLNTAGWPDEFGVNMLNYIRNHKFPDIRTLSLFSGAGGLDIGFHDMGFNIIESVEIEEKFCNTLVLNSGKGHKFENSKVNCIDIREYFVNDIGRIDWIIGGPPCQTFSAAGRRAAGVLGTTDARGVLFREYVRLLDTLQPRGFLFENVYGIVGAQNGEAWKEIKDSFSAIGYKLHYRILDAADYGVPQHRERLIIVGLKEGDYSFPRPTHGPDSMGNQPFYNAGTAVYGIDVSEKDKNSKINGRFGHLIDDIPPGLNYSFYTKEMGHPNPVFSWRSKFSDFMYKADPEMPVRTIKAQGGQYTGPLHWDNRYFTYDEFKRLQTFPDDYHISGNRQVALHQIGNSVPPQFARMLALSIGVEVFGYQLPFNLPLLSEYDKLTFRSDKRALTTYYREKAKEAIANLSANREMKIKNRTFNATLTAGFKYTEDVDNGQYLVDIKWNGNLHIKCFNTANISHDDSVIIEIKPVSTWTIPVNKIVMSINAKNWFDVTFMWRVLDHQLIVNGLKADLTQLNGYYQYKSEIDCKFVKCNLEKKEILETILSGELVSINVSTSELATKWNVLDTQVLDLAIFLRTIGYEVRNNKTNPQMKDDEWLIPYKFPTLVPMSVQLRKSLK